MSINESTVSVVFVSYDWRSEVVTESSPLTGGRISRQPLIRIFGYLEISGDPVCLVLRGFLPSFLVQKPRDIGALVECIDESDPVLHSIKSERNDDIYGFHFDKVDFVRCFINDPGQLATAAERIKNKFPSLRIYHTHIPYTLQFLIHYGIQGVSPIILKKKGLVLLDKSAPGRESECEWELHAHVDSIVRAERVEPNPSFRPEPLKVTDNAENQLVCGTSLDSIWDEEAKRHENVGFLLPNDRSEIGRPKAVDMQHVKDLQAEVDQLCRLTVSSPRSPEKKNYDFSDPLSLPEHFMSSTPLTERQSSSDDEHTPNKQGAHFAHGSPYKPTPRVEPTQETIQASLKSISNLFDDSVPISIWPKKSSLLCFKPPPPIPRQWKVPSQRWSLSGSLAQSQLMRDILPNGGSKVKEMTYGSLASFEICTLGEAVIALVAVLRDQRKDKDRVVGFLVRPRCDNMDLPDFDEVKVFQSERDLLVSVQHYIFSEFDPAVVLAWDATKDIIPILKSRMNLYTDMRFNLSRLVKRSGTQYESGSSLPGRIVLDLWRLLRSDDTLKLGTTSFCGCVEALLGLTVPNVASEVIAEWLSGTDTDKGLNRMKRQAQLLLNMLDSTCLLDRAVESARIYGCDISSVLSRGSQFKVECMLARASKRAGFALVSSSKPQVKNQSATEGIPMVLEPRSGFYADPVCVLDFQSLYPSIVIAYNICYSTCLGRMNSQFKLGTQDFKRDLQAAGKLPGGVIATPGNVIFVGRETRLGVLPRMLDEVLQSRFMVKKALKACSDPWLKRKLDARQLSLKWLANVTYGYTGASFSGRMPCSEVADAIVLTGRSTLENAMRMAEELGGKVIYGDTDSMFVQYKGASLDEAFVKGKELAERVTAANPWPMKLQMEKVYWPCCMITKKRYVGRAFDSPTSAPRFDAKGIETVRRDTCPLTGKTLTRILKTLFDNPRSLNPEVILHEAIRTEIGRILANDGTTGIRDYVFQNTVRDDYKDLQHLPPAARVALNFDLDVSRGERVAYVVVRRGPDAKVRDQVVPPYEVLSGRAMLDIDYYIYKQIIPAVQRVVGVDLGASILRWARELPQSRKATQFGGTLDIFVSRNKCKLCSGKASIPQESPLFCTSCFDRDSRLCHYVISRSLSNSEQRYSMLRKLCLNCASDGLTASHCNDAWHCSVYFEREKESVNLTCKREDMITSIRLAGIDW